MWKNIRTYWQKVWDAAPKLKARAEALRKKADDLGGKTATEKQIEVGADVVKKLYDKNGKLPVVAEMHGTISEIFRKAGENLDIIGDLIDKSMSNAVLKEGLTYRKASIIQYLEVFGFAQRYVRKLMLFTCACESAFLGTGKSAKEQFVPGDLKWMKANRDNFIQVMGILAGDPKQTRTTFEEIPDDIVLSQDKHDIVATTVGVSKLDPFNFGFIPVRFNPFYYVRMMVVEWQVKRYQAAVEERQAIELRILQLRAAADGKKDAALENQIEIVEGRLQKLNG